MSRSRSEGAENLVVALVGPFFVVPTLQLFFRSFISSSDRQTMMRESRNDWAYIPHHPARQLNSSRLRGVPLYYVCVELESWRTPTVLD